MLNRLQHTEQSPLFGVAMLKAMVCNPCSGDGSYICTFLCSRTCMCWSNVEPELFKSSGQDVHFEYDHASVQNNNTANSAVTYLCLDLCQYQILSSEEILRFKNGVFWDVTPCGSCKNRRFGGTWRLLDQGDKNR
jgi:hypothetical protein